MKHVNVYGETQDLSVVRPTIQAFNLSFNDGNKTLHWERGDGERVLVLLRRGDSVDKFPRDGVTYRLGEFICECKVIYKGTLSEVSLIGLEPGIYFVQAFEFNGLSSVERYLTIEAVDNPIMIEVTTDIDLYWRWESGEIVQWESGLNVEVE